MRILPVLSFLACVGALALAGVPAFLPQGQGSALQDSFQTRLLVLRDEVRQLRSALEEERRSGGEVAEAHAALAMDHSRLLAAHASLAQDATAMQQRLDQVDALEQEWQSQHASLKTVWSERHAQLESELQGLNQLRESLRAEAAAGSSALPTQQQILKEQVLGPVFQLSGGEAVGSAVLIHREQDSDAPHYLALSCFHVVRDILDGRDDFESYPEATFRAVFTDLDAKERSYPVRMVEWDVASDLALLRIDTDSDLGPLARLAPLERAQETGVFREIYTVGCPLGTAAQATHGLITRQTWEVDGENYWMVSSPAYFGNSGGGVFHAETHELIGIFAKIYTHGSYRPQVITHMGLAVPLPKLHDWLTEIGYAKVLPRSAVARAQPSNASGD